MKNPFKKIKTVIANNPDYEEIKDSSIKDIFDGRIFVKGFILRQMKWLILFGCLAMLYIDNRFRCEKQLARISELQTELVDIKLQSLNISADLMEISRQSEVKKIVNDRKLGLEDSSVPPYKIKRVKK